MSIDLNQFKEFIIIPALQVVELYQPESVELVLGTCIQESHLQYLKQLGGGPALGVIQMEPATHEDIWDNWLLFGAIVALLGTEWALRKKAGMP